MWIRDREWSNGYYWQTTQQQEIEYGEERDGLLHEFEFKGKPTKKTRFPKTFKREYTVGKNQMISHENMDEFLK